jgi:hypothetical protein
VVVVLPYVQAKGNATDQVLTNLKKENERKVFKMYPYLLNTAHLILILVPLHYFIGALGLKHRLVIIKLKKVFNLLLLLEALQVQLEWQCSERIQFLLQHN